MTQRDKDSTRKRHLRMAAKLERRNENEARRVRSDDESTHRVRDGDSLEDWNDEAEQAPARRRKRSARAKTKAKPRDERATTTAMVVGVARGLVRLSVNGERIEAPLGKTILSTPLTIGDELEIELRADGPPRIHGCNPRRNVLSRSDPGNKHKELLIAANVDVGVIVAAAASPPLRPALIDRYVIALERGGVRPLLCINKIDLCESESDRRALESALAPYADLDHSSGMRMIRISAERGDGIDELREALAGCTAVFVGHSGVGKSSVLNALAGRTLADAGDVRAFDGRGRHTTTASTLYELAGDVRVIDTAGIRAFGLWGSTPDELRLTFPGFDALSGDCRFSDCSHLHESGCAVRAAAEAGTFSASRYAIYTRMMADWDDD